MRKKLLYLTLLLLSLTTNAQTYFEGFEDAGVFPPPGWMVLDNGIGPAVQWIQEANPVVSAYDGIYAAYVGRENVSTGYRKIG